MIYPKKKNVIKAASGMPVEAIEGIDNAIVSGASSIPVYGQAVGAALSIGKGLGTAIEGDGTNGAKNAIAGIVNPMSGLNSIMAGKPLESIPIVGGFLKGRRMSKEAERLDLLKQKKDTKEANERSNAMFSKITYEDGGSLPGDESYKSGEAVVLGGNSHDDGGNALVDEETGEKVAETESEELVFSSEQTSKIEGHISMYNRTDDKRHLLELGRCIQKIVLNDMKDNSKKF